MDRIGRHDPALDHRLGVDPLAGRDPNADVALVAATDGDDPVIARRRVAQDQRHDVGLERLGHGTDDRRVRGREVQARRDGIAERGQPREQCRPLAQRLPFACERQCPRNAVPDEDHRVQIALIEGRRILAALDVEDADDGVARAQRHADLAAHVGTRGPVLGVLQDVADELGLSGPHHPTDDADRAVERLDHVVVTALGSETHEVAVARVDRDVAVAEARHEQMHDLVQCGRRRTVGGEDPPDRFDRGHLSSPPAHAGTRRLGALDGPFE